eukprot:m.14426 g.14426  ORF g.14426 m.14426 type:complete len:1101 (+) comp4797_c0_seq1:117-3419(+)
MVLRENTAATMRARVLVHASLVTAISLAALLLPSFSAAVAVASTGLSDHPLVGTAPHIALSSTASVARWTLSAPASDGKGCETVADTDLNTTQYLARLTDVSDAAACCAACRAHTGCLASVLDPTKHTCVLHNLTGLAARVPLLGVQTCFSGPAAGPAVSVPAHVPGDHITDLERAGLLEDPLFDDNINNSSLWGARTWTYTADFPSPRQVSGANVSMLLVFDGVKMGAHVTLNGHALGTVADQFLRYTFDASAALAAPGASNTLTLVFDQNIDVKGRFMSCSGGWDWAPYTTTYNRWGTKVFTLGIWKDVYVVPIAAGTAVITHLVPEVHYTGAYPTEPLIDKTAAPFTVNATVHTWSPAATSAELTVAGAWDPANSKTVAVEIPAGPGRVSAQLSAHGVKLWWPNGFGDQPLYNVTAELTFGSGGGDGETAAGTAAAVESASSETAVGTVAAPALGTAAPASTSAFKSASASASFPVTSTHAARASTTRRIGFRYAVLVTGNDTDPAYVEAAATQDGSSQRGEMNTFFFRVNGAPVYAKGANMVPMEEMEGHSDPDALRYLVRNAAAAGFTILRNWGGGIFQYDAWYDALDEFGILCYQDLMYAQGQHSPTYGDTTQAAEIAHQVRRLSHHPSMVLYTSCNECIFHGNMTLYINFAMQVVARETSVVALWPSCPASGWKSGVNRLTGFASGKPLQTGGHTLDLHGPYIQGCTEAFDPANGCHGTNKQEPFGPVTAPMLVNQSIWPPWGHSGPIGVDLQGTSFSEYGATVFSSFESMSATLSPENWGIQRPVWAGRNYPCDNFIHVFFGEDHSNVSAVGEAALQRQLWQCMVAQALYQKTYTEALRSMNTVLTQMWQFNEIWPTGGWGSIEWGRPSKGQVIGGRWKPLQHFLRRSVYARVGAACLVDGRCYVRNDGKDPFEGQLRLSLTRLDTGGVAWSATRALDIARGAHTAQWVCIKGGTSPGTNCTGWDDILSQARCTKVTCVFNADVQGDTGNAVLSSNQQLLAPPGELKVPTDAKVTATVGATRNDAGGIPVTVKATKTALLVTLTTLAWGVFSDNVFLLTPQAPITLHFIPYGTVDAQTLRASLRVVHLAQYL